MKPTIAENSEFLPQRLLLLLTLAVAGCGATDSDSPNDPPPPGPQWLVNATNQSGFEFLRDPGPEGLYFK